MTEEYILEQEKYTDICLVQILNTPAIVHCFAKDLKMSTTSFTNKFSKRTRSIQTNLPGDVGLTLRSQGLADCKEASKVCHKKIGCGLDQLDCRISLNMLEVFFQGIRIEVHEVTSYREGNCTVTSGCNRKTASNFCHDLLKLLQIDLMF